MSALVYHSRATNWPTPTELRRLLMAAQQRNARLGLSGVLLYDGGRYFQWLEGPAGAVSEVWESIQSDPRHDHVQLLAAQALPLRLFGQWTMKLACRPVALGLSGLEGTGSLIVPPPEAFARLKQDPLDAVAVLAGLSEPALATRPRAMRQDERRGFRSAWGASLCEAVIPRLLRAHRAGGASDRQAPVAEALAPTVADAVELAQRAIAADSQSAWDWVEAFTARGVPAGVLYTGLLEPAARRLGDLWAQDACLDADVTLGLCRLHLAARRLGPQFHRESEPLHRPHSVLVALQPGEGDMLGPTLACEHFWRDGWDVSCEFPPDDQALCHLVAGTHFDVLHLTLNLAYGRLHRLPSLAATITALRAASRNPALVVVLGGRACAERPLDAHATGADACCLDSAEGVRQADDALDAQDRRRAALH